MSAASILQGKHLVLGLTGGIACYKSAELVRLLTKAGATVQVVMTEGATRFITPLTLQALSGREVFESTWDSREAGGQANQMPHINLSREADAILVAPATADFMARLLHGRCDDLLSLMCVARPMERVPLILAPAMNREMWQHPATQRNVMQLEDDGAVVLDVGQGEQACGEVGDGRMLEPWEIIEELESFFVPKPLLGTQACVTAGPTYEAIDPVRGLTNRSSGKMGFAIARALQEAGAQVTLVAGPVCLPTPRGVERVNVQSAREMMAAVQAATSNARLFVACAAVADWRPQQAKDQKIKKQEGSAPAAIALEENPDILATVAHSDRARSGQLFCVGFAAETENLQAHAQAKRQRKGVPLLVANVGPETFGLDDNALTLFEDAGETQLARTDKLTLARQLVAHVAMRMPT